MKTKIIHPASQFPLVMSARLIASVVIFICGFAGVAEAEILFSGEKKLNNLVSELLEVSSISRSSNSFAFARSRDGWIFISSTYKGKGTVSIILDQESKGDTVIVHDADDGRELSEAMRHVTKGKHTIQVECKGDISVDKLAVKAV